MRMELGALKGLESADLNVTAVTWPAGRRVEAHMNSEVDVAMIVLAGGGFVWIDGAELKVVAGDVLIIEKGKERSIQAGSEGIRYVNVHPRRRKLMPI